MYDSEDKELLNTEEENYDENMTSIFLEEGERIIGIRGHQYCKGELTFDNLQFILLKQN